MLLRKTLRQCNVTCRIPEFIRRLSGRINGIPLKDKEFIRLSGLSGQNHKPTLTSLIKFQPLYILINDDKLINYNEIKGI